MAGVEPESDSGSQPEPVFDPELVVAVVAAPAEAEVKGPL